MPDLEEPTIADLDKLYLREQESYWSRRSLLKKNSQLHKSLNVLYSLLPDMVSNYVPAVGTQAEPQRLAFIQFTVGCCMQFNGAINALLRGQITESLSESRRALEFCLFAFNTFEHDDAAQKWIDAGTGWKDYRDAFKIIPMLDLMTYVTASTEEKGLLSTIISAYDRCCVPVHGTHFSITSKLIIRDTPEGPVPEWDYIDNLDDSAVLQEFFWIVEMHLIICKVLAGLAERLVVDFSALGFSNFLTDAEILYSAALTQEGLHSISESSKEFFYSEERPQAKRRKETSPFRDIRQESDEMSNGPDENNP